MPALPELALNRLETELARCGAGEIEHVTRNGACGVEVCDFALTPLAADLIGENDETNRNEFDHLTLHFAIDVTTLEEASRAGAACAVKLEDVEEAGNQRWAQVALVTLQWIVQGKHFEALFAEEELGLIGIT